MKLGNATKVQHWEAEPVQLEKWLIVNIIKQGKKKKGKKKKTKKKKKKKNPPTVTIRKILCFCHSGTSHFISLAEI